MDITIVINGNNLAMDKAPFYGNAARAKGIDPCSTVSAAREELH
jgi:hypothetical protein